MLSLFYLTQVSRSCHSVLSESALVWRGCSQVHSGRTHWCTQDLSCQKAGLPTREGKKIIHIIVSMVTFTLQQDSTQQTMLTTWLIELYLNKLGGLSDQGNRVAHKRLQQEFRDFLSQASLRVSSGGSYFTSGLVLWCVQECLDVNRKTVYTLISSHGAVEDMVFFATLMEGVLEKVLSSVSTSLSLSLSPSLPLRLWEGDHSLHPTRQLHWSSESADKQSIECPQTTPERAKASL